LCHPTALKRSTAGFTLIEALVALSIVAIAMASIGGIIGTSARGVRTIEGHLARLEIARAVMTALPGRDQLISGYLTGLIADHPWRVDVLPFATQPLGQKARAQWVPHAVVVTVQSPTGAAMKISTIRLQRSDEK
jgi:general secretion pathway protein I